MISQLNITPANYVNINVIDASQVELMVTTSEYNSKFQSIPMYDDGLNGDLLANDGIYSCLLPYAGNTDVKFYIRARNNDALSLLPERAEYEFYEYSTITNIEDIKDRNCRYIVQITDLLGREVTVCYNKPLFFIYSDGSVEKIILKQSD